jgi:hypothetical protein
MHSTAKTAQKPVAASGARATRKGASPPWFSPAISAKRHPGGQIGGVTGAVAVAALAALRALGCITQGRILWESAGEADAGEADAARPDGEPPPADAGIPAVIVLRGQTATGWHGGDGGDPYTDTCPASQVVTGYVGATFVDVDGGGPLTPVVSVVQAVCGAVHLAGDASDTIAVSPGSVLNARGSMQTALWSQMCPDEQVVVGFSGRSGNFVDRLAFVCAHWIASIGDGGISLSADSLTTLPGAGGFGGAAFPLEMCPPGQMATGEQIRAGFFVDQFALLCSTPVVSFADAGP